jgi:hypothetical protein
VPTAQSNLAAVSAPDRSSQYRSTSTALVRGGSVSTARHTASRSASALDSSGPARSGTVPTNSRPGLRCHQIRRSLTMILRTYASGLPPAVTRPRAGTP